MRAHWKPTLPWIAAIVSLSLVGCFALTVRANYFLSRASEYGLRAEPYEMRAATSAYKLDEDITRNTLNRGLLRNLVDPEGAVFSLSNGKYLRSIQRDLNKARAFRQAEKEFARAAARPWSRAPAETDGGEFEFE